jgi:hypothetical protein
MAERHPFIEDGSQWGVTRTAFRRMRKDNKRELMIQWFHEHFEDPAENTPYESAEGGYQWIWGGPCDTREELENKFGGIVSESLIDEVTKQLDRNGPGEWAPVQKPEDWEDIDWSERFDEPTPLNLYLDEASPHYGSKEEREARSKAETALTHLKSSLERRRPVGIGHNQPPDEIESHDVQEVREAARELQLEFAQPNPKISEVKRWATPIRDALIACGKWSAQKLDKAVDATATAIGTAVGTTLGVGLTAIILNQCFPSLHNAFDAIINWLEIAAKTVF